MSKQPSAVLRGHVSDVTCLRFHKPSGKLYSGDMDGQVIEWDINTRRSAYLFTNAHTMNVLQIQSIDNTQDSFLCTQGREGDLKCWDVEKRAAIQSIHYITPFETQQLSFCKFATSGSLASLPHSKNIIALYDINRTKAESSSLIDPDNKTSSSFNGTSRGMLMSLFFYSINGSLHLICGMENGQTLLYDLRNTNEPVYTLNPPENKSKPEDDEFDLLTGQSSSGDPILSLAVHDKKIITGTTGSSICMYSNAGNSWSVKQVPLSQPGVGDMVVAQDYPDKIVSRLLCTAGWDHRVRIYDVKKNKPLTVFKYHTNTVNCVDIRYGGVPLLASGSKDCRIALWSLDFKEKSK
ncbi:guanine nucleotide-binding protein subunit beta-like protein [Acrasis kona]|uniref:Guanine nucleotide-binding protein subunit beta-like protein n=1 Tax=Acrasis kona TaxID=1008807 RepID=A0AAW2ZFL7_9EUKA